MPPLSKPQATVLALWSLGMVLARSCALSAVRAFLAKGGERKPTTVRQKQKEHLAGTLLRGAQAAGYQTELVVKVKT